MKNQEEFKSSPVSEMYVDDSNRKLRFQFELSSFVFIFDTFESRSDGEKKQN